MLIVCQDFSPIQKGRLVFENIDVYIIERYDGNQWGILQEGDTISHSIVAKFGVHRNFLIFAGTEQECNHIDQIIRNAVRMKKEILDLTVYTKEYFDNYNKDLDKRIS